MERNEPGIRTGQLKNLWTGIKKQIIQAKIIVENVRGGRIKDDRFLHKKKKRCNKMKWKKWKRNSAIEAAGRRPIWVIQLIRSRN